MDKLILVSVDCVIGMGLTNVLFAAFLDHDWSRALEHSVFQISAIGTVLIAMAVL